MEKILKKFKKFKEEKRLYILEELVKQLNNTYYKPFHALTYYKSYIPIKEGTVVHPSFNPNDDYHYYNWMYTTVYSITDKKRIERLLNDYQVVIYNALNLDIDIEKVFNSNKNSLF